MQSYRCYLLNKDGRITAAEIIVCSDDEEARRVALGLQQERGSFAVEVWDQARRVLQNLETPVR